MCWGNGVGVLVVGAVIVAAVAVVSPVRPTPTVQADTTGSLFCASGLPCTSSSLYQAPLRDRLDVTGGSFDRLVRGSASDEWRSIESQARAFVAAVHQVPNDDRLLAVGRDSTRALMLIMLLDILERAEAGGPITPDERLALDAFEDAVRFKRTEAARLAVAEYDRWALSPCTYQVPAGFGFDPYGTVPCGGITTYSGPPPPPSIEQFQSYGSARVNETLLDADAAAAAQRLFYTMAYTSAIVLGVAAGALAGVLAATVPGLGIALLVAIGSVGAAKILAGTVATTAGVVAAASATGVAIVSGAVLLAASVVTIILIATAVTIIGAIQFAENARVRPALVDSFNAASTVDLAAMAATDEGVVELMSVVLSQSLPDLPAERVANSVAPAAWSPGNSEWSVLHPDGTRTRQSVLHTSTWEGRAQETFISEGYFVTRSKSVEGSWGPWALSLTLEHLTRVDGAQVQRAVGLSRDTLIPLDPNGATTAAPSGSFQPLGFQFNGGSIATVSITGNTAPSLAPTLSAAPVVGSDFTFIANESDANGDLVTVQWFIEKPNQLILGADVSLCGLKPIVPKSEQTPLTPRCPWPEWTGSTVLSNYGVPGTFGALVVATDSHGAQSSQRFTFTISRVAPTLTVNGGSTIRFLTEGTATTISGSVVYPGPTTGYDRPTLHVDWGDGTSSRLCAPFTAPECPFELSGGPIITEPRPFSIDHVYLHNPQAPIPTNMTIKVWADAPNGEWSPVVEIPIGLRNVAPLLSFNPNTCSPDVPLCVGDARGRTTRITGRIDDVAGSTHRVSVDWGDGSTDLLVPGCRDAGCPGVQPGWFLDIPSQTLQTRYYQLQHDYVPRAEPYTATVTVWDGGPAAPQTIQTTIEAVNRPPIVSGATVPFRLGGAFYTLPAGGLLAAATDPDGDLLTAELTSPPSRGTVTVDPNGAWSFIAGDADADQSFTFTVRDPFGGSVTETVQLELVEAVPNQAPMVQEAVISVLRGNLFTADDMANLNQYAFDPDGDQITFEIDTQGALGTAQILPTGEWTYVARSTTGGDSFTYRAIDPNGGVTVGTVRVEVIRWNGENQPPVTWVSWGQTNVKPGTTFTWDAPGVFIGTYDPNFDVLTARLGTPPTKGTAVIAPSGAWSYTADFGETGSDSFTFVISDDLGLSATGTIGILIDPPAAAPVVTPRSVTTPFNTPYVEASPGLLESAVDPGDLPLRAALATPPAKGTVDVFPDGAWMFTPNLGATGPDSFTFAVRNSGGGFATSTVDVQIESPPVTTSTSTTQPTVTTSTSTTQPTVTTSTVTTQPTVTTSTVTTQPTVTTSTVTTSTSTTQPSVTTSTTAPSTSGPPTTTMSTRLPGIGPNPPPFSSTIGGVPSPLRPGQRFTLPLPLGAIEHRVALYTTPVVLAAGGAATSVEVVIPADIAVGRHTLVVWVLVDGDVQISGLVVDVVAALTPGELPATGASPMPTTSIALVLLLLGAVIVVSTRRRRI